MEQTTLSERAEDGLEDAKAERPETARSESAPAGASAAIYGCAGVALGEEERDFFREAEPWGFILFARNVESPDQLRRLTLDLRDCVGWRAPILIDQEGGRVARMRAPHWRTWPAVGDWCQAADEGRLSEDALWELLALRYRMIADELLSVGVDVNCAPLLDLRLPGQSQVIGDRALGAEPESVSARGAVICQALEAGGVLPVVKHLPGHGRADVDSHEALPVVREERAELERSDFAAFAGLRDQALGMTAHIVYQALDPERPATQSEIVIREIIRGAIGFDGALMTDDLSMGALAEASPGRDIGAQAAESLAAGCDLALHCNGDLAEMYAAAGEIGRLEGEARRRTDAALARRRKAEPFAASEAERLSTALNEAGLS